MGASMQDTDSTDSKQIDAFDETGMTTDKDNTVLVISEKRDGVTDTSSRRETAISTDLDTHCLPKDKHSSTDSILYK
jgi:hypothetical protein